MSNRESKTEQPLEAFSSGMREVLNRATVRQHRVILMAVVETLRVMEEIDGMLNKLSKSRIISDLSDFVGKRVVEVTHFDRFER